MSLSLADALNQFAEQTGGTCAVGRLIEDLTPEHPAIAGELAIAARNAAIPLVRLARATILLVSKGTLDRPLTTGSIGRHRRGECRCV